MSVQAPGPSLEKAVLSIETDENGSAVLGSPDGKHFSIDSEDVGGNLDTFSVVNDKVGSSMGGELIRDLVWENWTVT